MLTFSVYANERSQERGARGSSRARTSAIDLPECTLTVQDRLKRYFSKIKFAEDPETRRWFLYPPD